MSRIIGVIPARLGSSRFPGKPLALLHGRPILEHVYRHAAACATLDEVIVATCDQAIAAAARACGARAVMTSPAHERASDRVAEAIAGMPGEIVVMIQGDEPMVTAAMIAAAVEPLRRDPVIACANLVAEIRTERELRDRNTIKVVLGAAGQALYFSREPIPTPGAAPFAPGLWLKQVCVIPFRRDALATFGTLPPGRLEQAESIDMLRFLEHGYVVHGVRTSIATQSVDTPEDLQLVAALMIDDEVRA